MMRERTLNCAEEAFAATRGTACHPCHPPPARDASLPASGRSCAGPNLNPNPREDPRGPVPGEAGEAGMVLNDAAAARSLRPNAAIGADMIVRTCFTSRPCSGSWRLLRMCRLPVCLGSCPLSLCIDFSVSFASSSGIIIR